MLSNENNELICRVGRGTPMGELMRQYWIPALPSSEFPSPDCPPKRMMLLGENLVMFRDIEGRMGALRNSVRIAAPASISVATRRAVCAAHTTAGSSTSPASASMPRRSSSNDTRSSCANIKARAYPCHEVNHMVWVYLGPRKEPPPFPQFEINAAARACLAVLPS